MISRRMVYLIGLVVGLAMLAEARGSVPAGGISWAGITLTLIGAILFIWVARGVDTLSPASDTARGDLRRLGRFVLSVRGMGTLLIPMSFIATLNAVRLNNSLPGTSPAQWLAFYSWLSGLVFFVLGCWLLSRASDESRTSQLRTEARSRFFVAACIVTCVGFAARALFRGEVPYPISGDEASVGMGGLAIMSGSVSNMFGTGWSSQPNLSFLVPGLFQKFFGSNIEGLRLFPAVAGTLAIPLVYLMVSEMWDRRIAILSAAYIATYHYHIHFSRIAVNNILDPTLFTAAFFFLWRALRTGRTFHFAVTGVLSGLGLYSYAGGRILMVLIGVTLILILARERSLPKRRAQGLFALGSGMLLAVLPMAVYFFGHPNEFGARMNAVGVFQTGWLDNQLAVPGNTLLSILADRLWRAFGAFTLVPATHGFYNSPQPLLDTVAGAMFVLGAAWTLWQWRERRTLALGIWFAAVVGGSALTVDLPNAARTVAVIPVVAVMVAVGIVKTVDVASAVVGLAPRFRYPLSSVALTLLCAASLHFYAMVYTPGRYFADANGEIGTEAGYYLQSLGPDYRVYFFGEPRIFFNFPSIEYLRGDIRGSDVPRTAGLDPVTMIAPGGRAAFIFIPERRAEAERVRDALPGSRLLTFPRRSRNEDLFLVVEAPPSR